MNNLTILFIKIKYGGVCAMNLEKLKELEDVKQELRQIGEEFAKIQDQRIDESLNKAVSGFKQFFSEKGFSINSINQNPLTASYGSIKVKLKVPKVEDAFVGVKTRLELYIESPTKRHFAILVNEKGKYPRITVKASSVHQLTDEEKLQKEIDKTREEIEKVKQKLEAIKNSNFVYGLVEEGVDKIDNHPQFDTMKELLEEVFK